jgi:hypothetical protein
MREDTTNLLKYMVTGGFGFGIGGIVFFELGKLYRELYSEYNGELIFMPVLFVGMFIIFGMICGVSLGIVSKNIKKMLYLALLGAVGLPIGLFISFGFLYIVLLITYYLQSFALPIIICFGLGGIITGAFFGIAVRRVLRLAIAGGLGYLIGVFSVIAIFSDMPSTIGFNYVTSFTFFNAIAGIFLGAGMYFAEKQTTNPKEER